MRKPFEPRNTYGTGRPRGSRNRWTTELIETMLQHFLNLAAAQPAGERTKIERAMDVTYKERPADYFKAARDLVAQLT
jgi:hypothetical protein